MSNRSQQKAPSPPSKSDLGGVQPGVSRRGFLGSLAGSSAFVGLAGCSGLTSGEARLPPPGTTGQAALLAPLSGPRASLGQIMRDAASIGGAALGPSAEISVIDSGSTAESAVQATQNAIASGANMIIGPLFSDQAPVVATAAGRGVPVVALTNNPAVATRNLFVFGITPQQSTKSMISFAASQGLRDLAIVTPPGPLGALFQGAAQALAPAFGVTLRPPITSASSSGLIAQLKSGGQNEALPGAVYLPVVGDGFTRQAAALSNAGVQILGSDQWSGIDPTRISALNDAWFAAPDPVRFEAFSIAFENRTKSEAGVVAGLTFDAVEMARVLGRLGQQTRNGLLREAGFDGVVGPYRFLENGQCERGLAILKVAQGATTLIGNTAV